VINPGKQINRLGFNTLERPAYYFNRHEFPLSNSEIFSNKNQFTFFIVTEILLLFKVLLYKKRALK